MSAIELDNRQTYTGWSILLQGWQGARFGILSWFSNPLFVAAAVAAFIGLRRAAAVVSGSGFILALTSFATAPLARRAGIPLTEVSFLSGFYLWLLAQGALFVSMTFLVILHQNVANTGSGSFESSPRD